MEGTTMDAKVMIGVWADDDEEFVVCRTCIIRDAGGDEIIGDADVISQRRSEAEASLCVEASVLLDGTRCDECSDYWDLRSMRWIPWKEYESEYGDA
jgi:hypothetical protein